LAERGLARPATNATRAALATLSGELRQRLGRTEEAIAAFRIAIEVAEPGRPRLRALLGLAHGLSVLDRFAETKEVLDRTQREAEEKGLLAEQSRAHSLRSNIHFPRGEIERCLAEHSEALRLAEASGALEEQARALGGLADANYMRGLFRTKYLLPLGLGLAAMMTADPDERRGFLAEGEQLLAEGAVSDNVVFFNRCAIEACLAAKDWDSVARYASAFERSMAQEPVPVSDFLVARARAISAVGRGLNADEELRRLKERATQVGWLA
jgi:tetratricopeptide (TPR) repeat protein